MNLRQEDLADLLGVTRGMIVRYEKQNQLPRTAQLCALARHLGRLNLLGCTITPDGATQSEDSICFDQSGGVNISGEALRVELLTGAIKVTSEVVLRPRKRA